MLRTNWQAAAGAGWQQQLETLHQKTGLRVRAGGGPGHRQPGARQRPAHPQNFQTSRWWRGGGRRPGLGRAAASLINMQLVRGRGHGPRQPRMVARDGGSEAGLCWPPPRPPEDLILLQQPHSVCWNRPARQHRSLHTPASKLYKVPQPCDHLQPNFVEVETQSFCQKITFLSAYSLSYELWSIVENF